MAAVTPAKPPRAFERRCVKRARLCDIHGIYLILVAVAVDENEFANFCDKALPQCPQSCSIPFLKLLIVLTFVYYILDFRIN